MPTADKLKEIRKKAQDAFADMPEGELKTKAGLGAILVILKICGQVRYD